MWNKTAIKLEDIPSIAMQGRVMAQAGNPLVEQIWCVFTLDDKKIIYTLPLLDYIDNVPEQSITSFHIYQKVA